MAFVQVLGLEHPASAFAQALGWVPRVSAFAQGLGWAHQVSAFAQVLGWEHPASACGAAWLCAAREPGTVPGLVGAIGLPVPGAPVGIGSIPSPGAGGAPAPWPGG